MMTAAINLTCYKETDTITFLGLVPTCREAVSDKSNRTISILFVTVQNARVIKYLLRQQSSTSNLFGKSKACGFQLQGTRDRDCV